MTERDDMTKEELIEEVNSHTAVTIPVDIRIEAQQKIQRCDAPIDVCLNLDNEAKDFIIKGLAKRISLKEALKALKRSHEAGLVHIAYTFKGREKPEVICSCCSCCCHSMSALVRFGMPMLL